jgi:hypothetical protein
MASVWDDIGKVEPDLENPRDIIKSIFDPIGKYTDDRVGYDLQEVGYFPEEVVYEPEGTSAYSIILSGLALTQKEKPHPEYGYDPSKDKNEKEIRYRLLLKSNNGKIFNFELFKFKYPIQFYPVTIYISSIEFPEMKDYIKSGSIIAIDEISLNDIIGIILKSASTQRLIKRIMVI